MRLLLWLLLVCIVHCLAQRWRKVKTAPIAHNFFAQQRSKCIDTLQWVRQHRAHAIQMAIAAADAGGDCAAAVACICRYRWGEHRCRWQRTITVQCQRMILKRCGYSWIRACKHTKRIDERTCVCFACVGWSECVWYIWSKRETVNFFWFVWRKKKKKETKSEKNGNILR